MFIKIQRDLKEHALSTVGGQAYLMSAKEKAALVEALDIYGNDYLPRVVAQCEQRLNLVGVSTAKKTAKAVKELATA